MKLKALLDQGTSLQVDPKGPPSNTSLGKWGIFKGGDWVGSDKT